VLPLLAGCGAPPDPGRTRPEAVRTTPYEQRDLLLSELELLRVRTIDVGPTGPDPAGPPVLLIPGHTSRIEEYDGLVPRLSQRRRVLVMDFPGSGYSEKPERDYTLAFYEDAALAFLDELGVERFHVAGGSLGGNLALRLAHRVPQRVDRVAAWAPGSAWEAKPWLAAAMRALGGYPLFWPVVRIQSRYWYREEWPGREAALADTFAYYREVLSPGFVRMYFGMAQDQVARSLFELAPAIGRPVWLGWGDQDDGADMGEGVARLQSLLPHSELHVFPGARHSLAAEVPEALSAEIEEFLSRPEADLPWAAGR
jgi:pimeloyl-ACP methyl ester carboxylesterase